MNTMTISHPDGQNRVDEMSDFMKSPTISKRRTVRPTSRNNLPLRKQKTTNNSKNCPPPPSGHGDPIFIVEWQQTMLDLDKHISNYRSYEKECKEEGDRLKKMKKGELYMVNRANKLQKEHDEMIGEMRAISDNLIPLEAEEIDLSDQIEVYKS